MTHEANGARGTSRSFIPAMKLVKNHMTRYGIVIEPTASIVHAATAKYALTGDLFKLARMSLDNTEDNRPVPSGY